jgi:hypothetical protein
MSRKWPKGERFSGFFKDQWAPVVDVALRDNRPVQKAPVRFWNVQGTRTGRWSGGLPQYGGKMQENLTQLLQAKDWEELERRVLASGL